VNLKWAVERVLRAARETVESGECVENVIARIQTEADSIAREDVETNLRIGQHGASLLGSDVTVLTHCNAGSLATVGYGTALGVIRAAVAMGKRVRVFAGETRPFLQGSRLTVYELMSEGIDVTLAVDSAVASLMKQGRIDAAIVGADRITANGDVANKIGTYSIACLARMHGVPFYVAAPTSTVDLSLTAPEEIPIEERPAEEVTHVAGKRVAPPGVKVLNPAFDVTPSCLVSAIITEHGVLRPPYPEALRAVCRSQAGGASRG
jgi:methylthioribose-1-phosphate isomerase